MPFAVLFMAVGPLAALYLGYRKKWEWTPSRFALWSLFFCFALNFFALLAAFAMNVRIVEPYRIGNLVKYILACTILIALTPCAYDLCERICEPHRIQNLFQEFRSHPLRAVIKRIALSRAVDYILVAAVCAFYLLLIRRNSYWLDEVWSLLAVRLDFPSMIDRIVRDVHPPLFYLPLYAVVHAFGTNDVLVKLMAILPWFAAVLAGIFFVKKQFGRGAMYFYVLAMACLPVFMRYALETRMYSLALCFCVYGGIALNKLLKNPSHRNFLAFSILSLLAAYTHYYALITVALLYLGAFVYFWGHRKAHARGRWFGYGALMAAGYAPWLPIFLAQMQSVNENFWVQSRPLSNYLTSFFGDADRFGILIPALLIVCFLWILVFFKRMASEDAWWSLICLGSLLGIVLFGALYEALVRPLLVPRYLIMALGLTVLGACAALGTMKKPYLACLMCLALLWSGATFWPRALEQETRAGQTAERTQAFVAEHGLGKEKIDCASKQAQSYLSKLFDYYLPEVSVGVVLPEHIDLTAVNPDGIWIFANDDAFEKTGIPASGLKYERYPGYGFEDIWFNIYHVWRASPASYTNAK